nr:aspartate aminotransferase family protein [Candidatus Poribacteria bacterium]
NLSPRRHAWIREYIDESTAQMLAEDERYFLHQSLSTPCLNVICESKGIYLQDMQGRRIMDFHGNSVHQVGHGNARVIEMIKKQLDEIPFCPRRYTNQVAIDLARRLVELAPGNLNKLLFTPSGTSAIGMALKLARYATSRHKTISMWGSFHGASLDAISIGGDSMFRKDVGPLLPGTEHIPPPTRGKCHFNCVDDEHTGCINYLDYILEREGDVAAIIAEPMRWATVELPPHNYWKRVREICDHRNVLLVFDEIPSAMGRTGKMFVCEHFNVVPDMLVIGKGLGGGVFPMAALIAREELDIVGDLALGHYTHEKSSVGCAAALATIDCLYEDGLIENAITLGKHAMDRLIKMQSRLPLIHEVRGLGLYMGIELRCDGKPACDETDRVLYHSLSRGLSYKVGGGCVLTLCPPMMITSDELDKALDIIEEGITSVS